jgi:hypothetical protein
MCGMTSINAAISIMKKTNRLKTLGTLKLHHGWKISSQTASNRFMTAKFSGGSSPQSNERKRRVMRSSRYSDPLIRIP